MDPANVDIDNRRPVWVALSELFLDTELVPEDFARLAKILAASPYTIEELRDILYGEVYPILIWNLRCTLGEWAYFDADRLESTILRREHRWFKLPRWVQSGHWMVEEPWSKIKEQILQTRGRW